MLIPQICTKCGSKQIETVPNDENTTIYVCKTCEGFCTIKNNKNNKNNKLRFISNGTLLKKN